MIAVPIEVIGLIGWCGYLIGFSLTTAKNAFLLNVNTTSRVVTNVTDLGHRLEYEYTCYWFFLVAGLVMNVAIFIHLNVARWFTAVIMNFLVGVCLASGGAIIQIDATFFFGLITTAGTTPSLYFQEPQVWILVEFVGACVSVVSTIIYMLLWPCISDSKECCKTSVAPENTILLTNSGPRLAFEEQLPNTESTNPKPSGSRMDNNPPPSFAEIHTLSRNVSTVTSPSAPPMNGSKYKSSSPYEIDRSSFAEEAPNEDTNHLM